MTKHAEQRPIERSRSIPVSALHQIHRKVMQKGSDIIALHIGEAHISIPKSAREAYVNALQDNKTSYCDAPGLLSLREALADNVSRMTNATVPVDRLFITPGSCQAISAVLQSIAFEGGIALLPEIHWPMHLQQVLMLGLKPRFYSTTAPNISLAESLEKVDDPNICAIIVNSPSNPGGQVIKPDMMQEIYLWAQKHKVWVISDEAYEDFIYEGDISIMGKLDGSTPEKERIVFSVRTFSKNYSMTGYRLGYVTAPNEERSELLLRVQEATLVAPSTPVQYAGLAAQADLKHLKAHYEYVKKTRDQVIKLLEPKKLLWTIPNGGWYALIDFSNYTDNADTLCSKLLNEAGVALAPGRSFARSGHEYAPRLARMAFCHEENYTLKGVQILLDYLSNEFEK